MTTASISTSSPGSHSEVTPTKVLAVWVWIAEDFLGRCDQRLER